MPRYSKSRAHPIAERLLRNMALDGTGCWLWVGAVQNSGYGRMGNRLAHRVAYEEWVGPIPAQHDVHHTCGVKRCINPWHLVTIDRIEHRRLHQAMDETCGRGHLRARHTTIKADGTRYCRACRRLREGGTA